MRILLGSLALALVISVLGAGTALATHSNGRGPSMDFQHVTHKGSCSTPAGFFPCHVHVNGQSESATGEPAQGHWYMRVFTAGSLDLPDPVVLSGEVICVTAIGSQSWARLRIDQSNTGLAPPGNTILDRAIDNGEGVNAPQDEWADIQTGPATTCPPIALSVTPIVQGNITNHDGI